MSAKIDLKFLSKDEPKHSIQVMCQANEEIVIIQRSENKHFCIVLDKSTAIKFAKTLRTEINKIDS